MKRFWRYLEHALDFSLLILILAGALYGLYYYRNLVRAQMTITLSLGVAYVLWGILHHWHEKNLKVKIIWEYVSIAALVVFILLIFLFRA